MIERLQLENILFLDIETVPQHENFMELDDTTQKPSIYAEMNLSLMNIMSVQESGQSLVK